MAEWKSANLGALFPPEVSAMASSASSVVSAVSPILDLVKSGLEVARLVLSDLTVIWNPADALATALEDFIQDFRATGIYYLPVLDKGLEDVAKLQINFRDDARLFDGLPISEEEDFDDNSSIHKQERIRKAYRAYFFNRYLGGSTGNSFNRFKRRIISSFDDAGDYERPVFAGDVAGVVLCVGAPSFAEYLNVLVQLADLFTNINEIKQLTRRLSNIMGEGMLDTFDHGGDKVKKEMEGSNPFSLEIGRPVRKNAVFVYYDDGILTPELVAVDDGQGGFVGRNGYTASGTVTYDEDAEITGLTISTDPHDDQKVTVEYIPQRLYSIPPDWTTINLDRLFPIIFEIADQYLLPLVNALRAGANIDDSMGFIIDAIERKVNELDEIVTTLSELIDVFDNIIGATGIYSIYVSSNSGIEGWKTELQNAANEPPFNEFDYFVGGIVLLAGGPQLTAFDNFFSGIA